jgi:DNA-binding CsgD family transcriptional regulator
MYLTPREIETQRQLLTGKSLAKCAAEMGIKLGTLKVYARWVYIKCGVTTRLELMAKHVDTTTPQSVP